MYKYLHLNTVKGVVIMRRNASVAFVILYCISYLGTMGWFAYFAAQEMFIVMMVGSFVLVTLSVYCRKKGNEERRSAQFIIRFDVTMSIVASILIVVYFVSSERSRWMLFCGVGGIILTIGLIRDWIWKLQQGKKES